MSKNVFTWEQNFKDIILELVPEFKKCVGFKQNNPHHIYDVWKHTLHALESTDESYDSITKLAILFHDIKKPECYREDKDGIGHFYGHSYAGADYVNNLFRFMCLSDSITIQVCQLIRYHEIQFEDSDEFVYKWIDRIGDLQFRRLLDLKVADVAAQNPLYRSNKYKILESLINRQNRIREEQDKLITIK